jgi:hydrogenase/urease accessory protein HupE
MIHMNAFKKTLGTISTVAALTLASTSVLAHTGHSHAQHDTLSGILHSLTTHPLLFGVIGLALVAAAYMSRN